MAYIKVDIDLEDFDDEYIFDEFINRIRRKSFTAEYKNEILDKIFDTQGGYGNFYLHIDNLADLQKAEYIKEIFHKYSISEIENKLPLK